MKREKLIKVGKELAQNIFGENADICSSWSIHPECYVGIVNKYGSVQEQKTPKMKPLELNAFLLGIKFAKEQEL